MTRVYQRNFVKTPYHLARTYLDAALRELVVNEEERLIRLRVPAHATLLTGDLEKNVLVTYGFGVDPMHFDQPWKIEWSPQGGGPYPDFEGTLTVRSDEGYETSILELEGQYKPPLGIVGQIFDAVIGSRIAGATARELLNTIGAEMERHFQRDEATKKAAREALS